MLNVVSPVTPDISGTTRIFPVIGWPVEQVKAPILFNTYFKRHQIDARVIPLKIAPESYNAAVRMLMSIENVGGILVSIPHKPMSVTAVDQVSKRALLAGACNAIYKNNSGGLSGDLIDGEGFIRAFDRTCKQSGTAFDWTNSTALIVGSGGVGCAVAEALATRAIGCIAIYDTQLAKARQLQQRLQSAFPATQISISAPSAVGFDLVVNSTPLGMLENDPLPVDLNGIAASCIVADCGMKIEMSQLLTQAALRGCRIQKGKEMLLEQAPLYLDLFGLPPAASHDFRILEVL